MEHLYGLLSQLLRYFACLQSRDNVGLFVSMQATVRRGFRQGTSQSNSTLLSRVSHYKWGLSCTTQLTLNRCCDTLSSLGRSSSMQHLKLSFGHEHVVLRSPADVWPRCQISSGEVSRSITQQQLMSHKQTSPWIEVYVSTYFSVAPHFCLPCLELGTLLVVFLGCLH